MKQFTKKTLRLLLLADGLWSVPVAYFLFWKYQSWARATFGPETGVTDPGILSSVIIASLIMIVAMNVINLGMRLNHNGLYGYYYNSRRDNKCKTDFNTLKPWQKVFLYPFLHLLYLVAFLYIMFKFI